MINKFRKKQLEAEVLEEVFKSVEEMKQQFKHWYMDEWEITLREFDAKQVEDESIKEDWSVSNARKNYTEGEYKMEFYDVVVKALEKLL